MQVPVVIELQDVWLKLAVAKPTTRGPQPARHLIVRPISNLQDHQIAQVMTETFRSLGVQPKPLLVCLPRNLVTVRTLHVPSKDPDEISRMIDLNIVRIVPYERDKALSSYQLMGSDGRGNARVLLAIAHREMMKRQIGIMEAGQLMADRILLSSFGVWEWVVSQQASEINADDLYLLLDVDWEFTDLLLFRRSELLLSRSIAVRAVQLADHTGLGSLLGEVKQSLDLFQTEETNNRPVKVFLSGAASQLTHLERAVGEGLGMPALTVNDPQDALGDDRQVRTQEEPKLVSLSAAMQFVTEPQRDRLTFTVPEIQLKRRFREKTRDLMRLGSLSIYLLTVVAGMSATNLYQQETYLKELQVRTAAAQEEIGPLIKQAERLDFVKKVLQARMVPLGSLAELQTIIPVEIAITFLSLERNRQAVIRGQAVQLADVFTFITALETSKMIERVEPTYTRRGKRKGKEVTEFELSVQMSMEAG